MKSCFQIIIPLGFLLFGISLHSQDFNIHNPIILPDKSQAALITQQIGYTDITIKYHSPGAKGRQVWGEMVPYGIVWRAGANENTIFNITDDVEIEGQKLSAGSYGLHLIPEADNWTFIFSTNHTSWGSYFYDESEDALRITVPVKTVKDNREWMSFDFIERDRASTSIALSWADKKATFELKLNINDLALAEIRKQLRSDAYWEWYSWCQAADYCAEYKINTEEALGWIDKSIQLEENFSNWDVKAKLLVQHGNEAGAKAAIERAIEVGSDVYLERYGRRFLNEKEYERALYIFQKALEKNEAYWRAHYNKGVALKNLGNQKEAIKALKAALNYAPLDKKATIENSLKSIIK